jgi:hypothetical protein
MGYSRQVRAKGSVISAASLSVVAVLSGCSASSGGAVASPARSPGPAAVQSARAAFVFTVAGTRPVPPGGSQDTHPAGARCDTATFAADETLGARVAHGFALAGLPAAASLLTHFLAGPGTQVSYRAGSRLSEQALASTAFRTVNDEVQEAILRQLKAGPAVVHLSAAQLPTVAFESRTSDLYWGFRGTQGLTVTGSGRRENGRYTGTLTYVIRDSYGFPAGDTLDGFGPPMRYLQTACGAPQHAGGAHWFPDTITLTVPFSQPASESSSR